MYYEGFMRRVKFKSQKSKVKNTNNNSKLLTFELNFCLLQFEF